MDRQNCPCPVLRVAAEEEKEEEEQTHTRLFRNPKKSEKMKKRRWEKERRQGGRKWVDGCLVCLWGATIAICLSGSLCGTALHQRTSKLGITSSHIRCMWVCREGERERERKVNFSEQLPGLKDSLFSPFFLFWHSYYHCIATQRFKNIQTIYT